MAPKGTMSRRTQAALPLHLLLCLFPLLPLFIHSSSLDFVSIVSNIMQNFQVRINTYNSTPLEHTRMKGQPHLKEYEKNLESIEF